MTLDNLTSPTWWVTAVVGAIALKIASDYARQGLEKLVSSVFQAWRRRSETAKEKFDRTTKELAVDSEMRERYYRREIRYALIAIMCFVMGSFSMAGWATVVALQGGKFPSFAGNTNPMGAWELVLANAFCALCVTVSMVAGIGVFSKSTNIMIQLNEAERIRRRSAAEVVQTA
ncbi:hypothetical protein [Burkholderia cenocepacia]|uniref:hypothetical protein n=1 Tax=Burkholderia cenocepacia TaxID=95486 RepID=UPI002AB79F7C|nr:hypothetical protein [Burkholderia cenocepacia]